MDQWLAFDEPAPGLLQQLRHHRPIGLTVLALALIALAIVVGTDGRTPTNQSVAPASLGSVAPFLGFDPSLGYDAKRRQVVLVNNPGETWLWAYQAWTRVQPAQSPPAGCCNISAWDPDLGRVLLFGVEPAGDVEQFSYTYAWDGKTWAQIERGAVQPPAGTASMAYDPRHHQMVMVLSLGTAAGTIQEQTWIFQGGRWLRRSDLDSPAPSFITAVGFDAPSHTLLAVSSDVADPGTATWRWDGTGWHRLTPSHQPPGSAHMTLVNEPGSGKLLLLTQAYAPFGVTTVTQTWIWDGHDWVEHLPLGQSDLIPYAVSAMSDGVHGTLWAFEEFPPDTYARRSVETLRWSGASWDHVAVVGVSPAR